MKKGARFHCVCLCVLFVLIIADGCVLARGSSYLGIGLTTVAVNTNSSVPFDIHVSNGYERFRPRDLVVNYSYAISASGTSFQISIHVAQSFAYADVTGTTIVVNPEKPFTYVTEYDELGNDVLTIKFDSPSPLGQFYLTVLQHVTVYSIKYTVDPAKVGTYDKSSELYKVYTAGAEYLESDNSEIVATSRQVVGDERNPYLAARKIQSFVVQHMTYDTAAVTPWRPETEGALFALHSGKGVCRHFPALFTALARAAGIPTADIWGSAPTDGGSLTDPGDLKHNWVQFYVPNYGWVLADPAWENTQGVDWYAQLRDNSHVPIQSVNYLYKTAWWSGGDAEPIIGGGVNRFGPSGEAPTVSRSPTGITANVPQEVSWNALSDATGDLIDQNSRAVGDLGPPYSDITNLSYGFVGGSSYFRFDLHGQLPSQVDTKHVSGFWYQVYIDADSDSVAGYLWRNDFTPDYVLGVDITSRTSGTLYSSVFGYAGSGKDWKWIVLDYNTQQAILAGGIGHDYLVLSCRNGDISVVEGSTIRVLARTGIMYDGKVYNDLAPDKDVLAVTLPSSRPTTASSGTAAVTATPLTLTSTSGEIAPNPVAVVADTGQTLLFAALGIFIIGIAILVMRKRRPGAREES